LPESDGQEVTVTQSDAAGNESGETPATLPDTLAPSAPAVSVGEDGVTLTITGEPGATATIYDAENGIITTVELGETGEASYPLPESNGQSVTVTQSDAAGNESTASPATLPDTLAPEAPTVTVGEDGVTLTITGEPGATATIYGDDGEVIDTVALGTAGEATYTLPESNGQQVTVSQTDAAGNESGETPATLPDSLAPAAPTVTVGADGLTLTITGEPGATATIHNALGAVIDTVALGTGGTATYTLAQSNGQDVFVTQTDEAGNQSGSSPATLPDTLAPLTPTDLTISADGGTVSGKGEPDARVVIRDNDDNIIGEGTVGSNGSFQIVLTTPQRDGGALSVTLEDAANNESLPGSVTAPFIDPTTTIPVDDNASAEVVVQPSETAVTYPGASYLALVGLLGIDIRVLSVPSVNITVAQGHEQNLQLTYSQLLGVDLASGTAIIIQKLMPDGTWAAVDGVGDGTLLNLILLGNSAQASILLGEGTYRAFAAVQGVLNIGLAGNLAVSGTDLNYHEPSGVQVGAVEGNVLTNDGGSADAGHDVTSVTVNGVSTTIVAGEQGTSVTGQYGTLLIHQDGSYTYTPNASLANIGKVDVFTYTKTDPVTGATTTAELNIRIDSDGQGLVWNDDDFSEPATYDFAAANDTNASGIIWANVVNNAFFDQTQTLGAALGIPQTSNSNPFTIGSNMDAFGTVHVSVNVAALASGTVVLQRLVGGTWQNFGTVETFSMGVNALGIIKTIDIGSLDLPAGQYRVHTTLTGVLGSVNTVTDVNVLYPDQHVIQSNPGTTGNLFDNDGTLPLAAKLQVQGSTGFVNISATGTVIQGVHGDLTIYSNGEYKYQPHSNLSYANREASDTFTYKIVLPNGHETTATLTVDLEENAQISRLSSSEENTQETAVADHHTSDVTATDDHASTTDSDTTHHLTDDAATDHQDADASQPADETTTVADEQASDVVPLADHIQTGTAGAETDQSTVGHNLTEALLLDDGSGDVTLPFHDNHVTDYSSSPEVPATDVDTSMLTANDAAVVDDPLAHLVPDPLTQEDNLHTMHTV
jgi:VCBS repeat-containing protein